MLLFNTRSCQNWTRRSLFYWTNKNMIIVLIECLCLGGSGSLVSWLGYSPCVLKWSSAEIDWTPAAENAGLESYEQCIIILFVLLTTNLTTVVQARCSLGQQRPRRRRHCLLRLCHLKAYINGRSSSCTSPAIRDSTCLYVEASALNDDHVRTHINIR